MAAPLILEVNEPKVAFVGDVHGESDALESLLQHLDKDIFLVFMGDLVDRGRDSLSVIRRVAQLMKEGRATCLLGNHELNLLRGEQKSGNHWFFGREEAMPGTKRSYYHSRLLENEDEREECLEFFKSLPVALEGSDFKAVHACWDEDSVQALRSISRAEFEQSEFGKPGDQPELSARYFSYDAGPPPFDVNLAKKQVEVQMSSPVDILCSGKERVIPARRSFFAGGKWRHVERDPWWDEYRGTPAIVGHYWRLRNPPNYHRARAIPNARPEGWWGRGYVYCVDFSVGRRYRERFDGGKRQSALAALVWPERKLVFDDGHEVEVKAPGPKAEA